MGQQVEINVHNSLNTNTISEDIRTFTDNAAPSLQNTGIERDGGVTNIYETVEAYATAGDHFITEDANVLQSVVSGDTRQISVDGRQIGIVSAYGVEKRLQIQGCNDACITSTGTYLTAAVKGSGIEVCEYSTAQVLLNSRTTTFTNLAAVLQFFTSLSIVRYNGIKYADSLEFALRLGPQFVLLKESTPSQNIIKSLKGRVLGTATTNDVRAFVYGGFLIIAGEAGRVSSFDGSAWRYYDGTGTGTGPYNSGTSTGSQNISSMASFTENGVEYLVLLSSGGRVSSYASGLWNDYNKAGVGLWNNAAVVGSSGYTLCSFTSASGVAYLAVGSGAGNLGSYTTSGGWVLYTAGSGLCNNATLIGAQPIYSITHILTGGGESCLVISGGGGRVGSKRYTAGAWNTAVYTTGSTADNPTNNATVCGANTIVGAVNWGANDIVFLSSVGTVGHWHNYAWYNYNGAGGSGVCINNQTALGVTGYKICVFGLTIVISNASRTASWSYSNEAWKNYDGSGTGLGIYSSGNAYFLGNYTALCVYNSQLIVAGNQVVWGESYVANISAAGIYDPYYIDSSTGITYPSQLFEGMEGAYLYCYRYENSFATNRYLVNITGTAANRSYMLNTGTTSLYILPARYFIPQRSALTKHIAVGNVSIAASASYNIYGKVGYSGAVFSDTLIYYNNPQTSPTEIKTQLGFNYADSVFSLAASPTYRENYVPQFVASAPSPFKMYQTQSALCMDAYGKITNFYGLTPSVPVEFRVGVINGVMAFYSAAVLDGIGPDAMGTLLSNVGEIDIDYTPDFQDDRIMYRYNGNFVYVILSKTLTGNVFQKIAPKLYKLNTISPNNILSMVDQALHIGSSDYHGQMIFESTAAPSTTATNVASVMAGTVTDNPLAEGIFSNSIDVGDKLCYITSPTSANIALVGYRVPYAYPTTKELIATYINDVYSFSTANDGSELVVTDRVNTIYVEDTRLPVQIGSTYGDGVVNTGTQTIFLVKNYDGYTIGNEAKGLYTVFQLFGTIYLFDGNTIYQASLSGDIYSGLTEIAPATGLTFIAVTPTQAYFLSAFDNSIYVFTGGRSLSKFQRLSQMAAVTGGVYSTRDNALLLETASTFIWVRDDIVTQNNKTAAQTAIKLYDTTKGIYIGNDSYNWRYSYSSLGGSSTVVPLSWQSSYYGQGNNQKSILSGFMATLYCPGKAAQTIQVGTESFDERAHYSDLKPITLKPCDYSSGGYVRLRIQPETQRTLGASIKFVIPAKTVLVDLVAEFAEDAKGIVAGNVTA